MVQLILNRPQQDIIQDAGLHNHLENLIQGLVLVRQNFLLQRLRIEADCLRRLRLLLLQSFLQLLDFILKFVDPFLTAVRLNQAVFPVGPCLVDQVLQVTRQGDILAFSFGSPLVRDLFFGVDLYRAPVVRKFHVVVIVRHNSSPPHFCISITGSKLLFVW